MCFSASSSFTAAFFLLSVGALTVLRIKNRSQLMFSLIPFLFGIQQACEGIVWLTLNTPDSFLHKAAAFLFLIFAITVWPIWIPISIFCFEKGIRKILLFILSIIGALVAIYVSYFMMKNGVTVMPMENSIFYNIGDVDPFSPKLDIIIYCLPTILPFLITKMPYAKLAGLTILGSLLIAYYFKYETFGSVWCFFAAILSIFVLFCLDAMNKNNHQYSNLEDLV